MAATVREEVGSTFKRWGSAEVRKRETVAR